MTRLTTVVLGGSFTIDYPRNVLYLNEISLWNSHLLHLIVPLSFFSTMLTIRIYMFNRKCCTELSQASSKL